MVTTTYDEVAPVQLDRSDRDLFRRYTTESSNFIELDDATVHYREEGTPDGPPLLLIHGTYSSLHTWDGWVEELGEEFRLIRLDLPGFGLTGPLESGDHRLETIIRTVGAFCDALQLTDLAVAGNSLGGAVAWRLSIERPELVSSLVLLDAGGATLLSNLGKKFSPLGAEFMPRYLTPRSVVRLLLKDAYGDPTKLTDETVRRYHDLVLRAGNRRAVIEIARNYRRDHGNGTAYDLLDVGTPSLPSNCKHPSPSVRDGYDIGDVSVPILFQWGSRDEWLPVSFGKELAAKTDDHTFVTYEGVGHVPMEEAPAKTAADAAAFLQRTVPRPAAD